MDREPVPTRSAKLAGPRGSEPSTLRYAPSLRCNHRFTHYSPGRFRNFQRSHNVSPLLNYGDRDPAFDGLSRCDISVIFLWQGAVFTWGVSKIPIEVRGILDANHFLVTWDWHHYLWATVLAMIAVFIASDVPARRAEQLAPVATLPGSN